MRRGATVGLYLHVPFCPRLCWWCACRTELSAPGRPAEHAQTLEMELGLLAEALPAGIKLGRLHLGGGSPAMLGGERLAALVARAMDAFTPTRGTEVVFEAASFDHDEGVDAIVAALSRMMPVAVTLGFGAPGGPDGSLALDTEVATIARVMRAGAVSVSADVLVGLPGEAPDGFGRRLKAIIAARPARVILTPWAHAPLRARRQARLGGAAPGFTARAAQTDAAGEALSRAGYRLVGAATWVRRGDPLLAAAAGDRLCWGFDGLNERSGDAVIGLGPSAVSRLPSGLAQNPGAYAAWRRMVLAGRLPAWRGHLSTAPSRLRADLVSDLVCRGRVEIDRLARIHGPSARALGPAVRRLIRDAPAGMVVPLSGPGEGVGGFMLTRPGLDGAQRCALALLEALSRDADGALGAHVV
ncbi:MAG: hypothetical protein AAF577_05750 [Pseudomonadota bacterium]